MQTSEIWENVIGYEGLYEISNIGNVRSVSREVKCNKGYRKIFGRILSTDFDGRYYSILLRKNSKCSRKLIHRLVAEAFISNPMNLPQVNHIDFNKSNNNYHNLEWVTAKENIQYSIKNGNYKNAHFNKGKKIKQYNKDNVLLYTYNSITDAEKRTKVNGVNIVKCAKGTRPTAGNYIWRY